MCVFYVTRDAKRGPLSMLREILITYATFHQDVGYAQGMNDILARFLYVFDSEVSIKEGTTSVILTTTWLFS